MSVRDRSENDDVSVVGCGCRAEPMRMRGQEVTVSLLIHVGDPKDCMSSLPTQGVVRATFR